MLQIPGRKPYFAPGFVRRSMENYLALLITAEEIIYSETVYQVFLTYRFTSNENVQAVATGLGQLQADNPNSRLQFLTMNNEAACLDYFPNAGNKTLCAIGAFHNCGSLLNENVRYLNRMSGVWPFDNYPIISFSFSFYHEVTETR